MLSLPSLSIGFNNPNLSDRVLLFKKSGSEAKNEKLVSGPQAGHKRKADDAGLDDDDAPVSKEAKIDADSPSIVRKLHVNTLVLAGQSEVFHAMLTNGMQESKEKQFVIEVSDEADAIRHGWLIEFLYSGQLPKDASSSELMDLLLLANKYEIKTALQACSAALCTNMTFETSVQLVELQQSMQLSPGCESVFIKANDVLDFDACWQGPEFQNLSVHAQSVVLSRLHLDLTSQTNYLYWFSDDLMIKSENTIYECLGRSAPDDAEQLKGCLRIPMMSKRYLTHQVVPNSLFDYEELMPALLFWMNSAQERTKELKAMGDRTQYRKRAGFVTQPSTSIEFTFKLDDVTESKQATSPDVMLAGYEFHAVIECDISQKTKLPIFGGYLGLTGDEAKVIVPVHYQIFLQHRLSKTFESVMRTLPDGPAIYEKTRFLWGKADLFGMSKSDALRLDRNQYLDDHGNVTIQIKFAFCDEVWWS